jgi:hypothetical protein
MASLKATVMTPPVTTLSALLVLVDTLKASALAAVETIDGSVPPPPQAVMAAAASEVTTQKYGLDDLEKAFMIGLVQTDNLDAFAGSIPHGIDQRFAASMFHR